MTRQKDAESLGRWERPPGGGPGTEPGVKGKLGLSRVFKRTHFFFFFNLQKGTFLNSKGCGGLVNPGSLYPSCWGRW